ncbi:alpha/beta hydrolase [Dictyobacter arantiisoli]|uniref:Lipase/esterase n=1 Tax=Dictyobacter arantiisoli TaxID=2014874 RepID=A0A5A5T7U8_9CHLR|nr:alpha/beta hydrolase [Dictyobacter arantiisoli]GCF07530.1 lipase/esterase [Dictyobacter arantiisoli]
MPLDPYFQALLDQRQISAAHPQQDTELFLFTARAKAKKDEALAQSSRTEPLARVEDRTIPGPDEAIAVRIYIPEGEGPFPILVYLHGGGWISGNINLFDHVCRSLCHGAQCLVMSVGYRLAPEIKFPGGLEDCYASICWIAENAELFNADSERIAVGGDSAGGNLAAAVTQIIRDLGGPALAFQLLFYPLCDFRLSAPSWEELEHYFSSRATIARIRELYLNNEAEQLNPYASPLLAEDLSDLPPALIIIPEYDQLRDDGTLYGQKLQAAGVPVHISHYAGMIHGFMSMGAVVPQAQQALSEASAALRTAFAIPTL